MITENDIIDNVFYPSRICSKLLNIKKSDKWSSVLQISAVSCHPKIKNDFYNWALILLGDDLRENIKQSPGAIMIQEVLNLFPEYTVEPRLKECLITYKDKHNEDDFDLPSIRDKLIKMESLKANCRISMIPCDIRIKKDFYSLAQKK